MAAFICFLVLYLGKSKSICSEKSNGDFKYKVRPGSGHEMLMVLMILKLS